MEKITVEANTLRKSLMRINSIINQRNTIPILSCVKMKLNKKGSLDITGTDLDFQVCSECELMADQKSSSEFGVCVGSDILLKAINSLRGYTLEIYIGEPGQVTIKDTDGLTLTHLKTLPIEDFPVIEDVVNSIDPVAFTNGQFVEHMKLPATVMSDEETRYYLNGVHWYIGPKGSYFEATDGHRLIRNHYDKEPVMIERHIDRTGFMSAIIPKHVVKFIVKELAGQDCKTRISIEKSIMSITSVGMKIITKLIDGTFPDTDRVIPKDADKFARLKRQDFRKAIEIISIFNGKFKRAAKFTHEDGVTKVSSNNPDWGNTEVILDGEWPAAINVIGFNSDYVKKMLDGVPSDEIHLAFKDGSSPTKVIDPNAPDITRILMPMRV